MCHELAFDNPKQCIVLSHILPHDADVEDDEGEDGDDDVEDGVEPQNVDIQVPVGAPGKYNILKGSL